MYLNPDLESNDPADIQERIFRLLISRFNNEIEVGIEELDDVNMSLPMWMSINPESQKFKIEIITQDEFNRRNQPE